MVLAFLAHSGFVRLHLLPSLDPAILDLGGLEGCLRDLIASVTALSDILDERTAAKLSAIRDTALADNFPMTDADILELYIDTLFEDPQSCSAPLGMDALEANIPHSVPLNAEPGARSIQGLKYSPSGWESTSRGGSLFECPLILESMRREDLLLIYHGTVWADADSIRDYGVRFSDRRNDFSNRARPGFYTTRQWQQAKEWALKTARTRTDLLRHSQPESQYEYFGAVVVFAVPRSLLGADQHYLQLSEDDRWRALVRTCRSDSSRHSERAASIIEGPVWCGRDKYGNWTAIPGYDRMCALGSHLTQLYSDALCGVVYLRSL
eukprot:m.59240 g.59240  ORF g.59240 m.59240 type:complete len:323 (-) comp6950_c0_seq1:225-1193(-)